MNGGVYCMNRVTRKFLSLGKYRKVWKYLLYLPNLRDRTRKIPTNDDCIFQKNAVTLHTKTICSVSGAKMNYAL